MVLTDFGLSKLVVDNVLSASSLQHIGVLAYSDPQCHRIKDYRSDEKSDIYSLGVIYWEILSGRRVFANLSDFELVLQLYNGKREAAIANTPPNYIKLYQECWDNDSQHRPAAAEVVERLHDITTPIGTTETSAVSSSNDSTLAISNMENVEIDEPASD